EKDQSTGTSLSIIQCWTPLRQAGATARLMLIEAAARRWRVPPGSCQAQRGVVLHSASGRRLSYGELATAAAALPQPPPPPLKAPKDFRLIGRATSRRDTPSKVDGSAQFGIDARPPLAQVALIALSPVEGGRGVVAASKGLPAESAARAAHHHEAIYHQPFLAHATLEPMNCTLDWREDVCEIWTGTQACDRAVAKLAALGLEPEQIRLHSYLIGGGFGRRLEV